MRGLIVRIHKCCDLPKVPFSDDAQVVVQQRVLNTRV